VDAEVNGMHPTDSSVGVRILARWLCLRVAARTPQINIAGIMRRLTFQNVQRTKIDTCPIFSLYVF